MQIMIQPSKNIDRMVGQAMTPPRRRTPNQIRMPSMKIMPSMGQRPKELPRCLSNRNLQDHPNKLYANMNNTNQQDISYLWDNRRKGKPMISPIPNQPIALGGKYSRKGRDRSVGGRGYSVTTDSNLQENISGVGCANHPHKVAEFLIYIEAEVIEYCEKCAAQLASQGFTVHKLEDQSTVKKHHLPFLIPELPYYSQYQNNPMYGKILNFLKELNSIEEEHFCNMKTFGETDEHYQNQMQITQNFYNELLKTIEVMKEDHLADLLEESKKHSQIADIEKDYLRENVDQMEYIRKDIEENLETIMEKVDEEQLEINLNQYKQKLHIFKHKTEEQNGIFNQFINYSEEEISHKLTLIQNYLLDVWLEKQPKKTHKQQSKQNVNGNNKKLQNDDEKVTNILQIKPPNGQAQRMQHNPHQKPPLNPAFRKLFDEEDESQKIHHQTSPQFKNI